jgi:hypothetical protein
MLPRQVLLEGKKKGAAVVYRVWYICICMCVCAYMRTHTHIYYIHACNIYTYMYTCVCTYMYVCIMFGGCECRGGRGGGGDLVVAEGFHDKKIHFGFC